MLNKLACRHQYRQSSYADIYSSGQYSMALGQCIKLYLSYSSTTTALTDMQNWSRVEI